LISRSAALAPCSFHSLPPPHTGRATAASSLVAHCGAGFVEYWALCRKTISAANDNLACVRACWRAAITKLALLALPPPCHHRQYQLTLALRPRLLGRLPTRSAAFEAAPCESLGHQQQCPCLFYPQSFLTSSQTPQFFPSSLLSVLTVTGVRCLQRGAPTVKR
jgi:hypothetical protein